MLVLIKNKGQLGNKLSLFAHFIAFAIENEITVINPGFDEYANFFQMTGANPLCLYPPKKFLLSKNKLTKRLTYCFTQHLHRLIYRLDKSKIICNHLRIIRSKDNKKRFSLSSPKFLKIVNQNKIIFCIGYYFRDDLNVAKHAERIRTYFIPAEKHQKNISAIIEKARKSCKVLVGVHMRQGDYRHFSEGKYFYEMDDYIQIMRKVENLFPNKDIAFLVCSNVEQNEEKLSKFNFTLSSGNIVEDMYSLAQCDYIVGPPSSYSRWAAFYGNVPIYCIEDPSADIALDNFKFYQVPLH